MTAKWARYWCIQNWENWGYLNQRTKLFQSLFMCQSVQWMLNSANGSRVIWFRIAHPLTPCSDTKDIIAWTCSTTAGKTGVVLYSATSLRYPLTRFSTLHFLGRIRKKGESHVSLRKCHVAAEFVMGSVHSKYLSNWLL